MSGVVRGGDWDVKWKNEKGSKNVSSCGHYPNSVHNSRQIWDFNEIPIT